MLRAITTVALVSGASAFSLATPLRSPQQLARAGAVFMDEDAAAPKAPKGMVEVKPTLWSDDMKADIRIEGGSSLQTFQMPQHAERVQYIITSPTGRPIKAKVELWIGPLRCVHTMQYDCMNGIDFPIRGTLQFKKLAPVLKISTDGTYEFPLVCGVFVPSPEESKKIGQLKKDHFYSAPLKDKIQGGSTIDNKGGAIRSFPIPADWDKVQIMLWSVDTGKKSMRSDIEILQGPNNPKQKITLQCGGSTQPWHGVLQTPGPGWMIRMNSKKYLEDGLFEVAINKYGDSSGDSSDVVVGGGWAR